MACWIFLKTLKLYSLDINNVEFDTYHNSKHVRGPGCETVRKLLESYLSQGIRLTIGHPASVAKNSSQNPPHHRLPNQPHRRQISTTKTRTRA